MTPQREFMVIRARTGRGRAYFASSRLLVLPHRFMRKLGGAAAIWRWTCISDALLDAPADVRRAVIAHEWGHAHAGHCLATMGALAAALLYAVSTLTLPPTPAWVSFNIALLVGMGAMLLWAINPRREFEADAVAARVVGRDGMASGLRWIVEHVKGGEMSDAVRRRLEVLER